MPGIPIEDIRVNGAEEIYILVTVQDNIFWRMVISEGGNYYSETITGSRMDE